MCNSFDMFGDYKDRGNTFKEDSGGAVKKVLIAIFSLLLVYGLLREYTVARVLVVIAGAAAGYAIFRLPQRSIEAMKYPLIVISFLVTILFFFYPRIAIPEAARMAIVFVSFYAFILYLTGMEEKGQDFFKEVTALSILFFSSGFNLYITGKLVFMISFAATLVLFLFIIGQYRIIPFIAAYASIAAFALAYRRGAVLLAAGSRASPGSTGTCSSGRPSPFSSRVRLRHEEEAPSPPCLPFSVSFTSPWTSFSS